MAAPDIDFKLIRLHRDTRADAFEELCCQLARDEADRQSLPFIRKGRGADGGLEAFATLPSGDEVGWQVKYYWTVDSLLTALTGSLDAALAAHPRMTRFIAAFPFDLADSRKPKTKTALQKWTDWETAAISKAFAGGRAIMIERWDASTLKDRLARDPTAAGRINFWFDQTLFDQTWFEARFKRAVDALGSRYTAETHLGLPIRRAILATTRDLGFSTELRAFEAGLSALASRLPVSGKPSEAATRSATAAAVDALIAASALASGDVPVDSLLQMTRTAQDATGAWRQELRSAAPGRDGEDTRIVSALHSSLGDIADHLASPRWGLINARRLLVFGEGGRGKSHLLADACRHQVSRGLPAVFVLSNTLQNREPWAQIIADMGLPSHLGRADFLSALDSAARAAGVRALLVIDGINERDGQAIWSTHLAAFLSDAERYDWITIILSCRTTYMRQTVPDGILAAYLPRLEHEGFSIADAEHYLALRGISMPEAPWPLEEFRTPLFLRTLCDGLIADGKTTLPKGSNGLSAIFSLYAEAITRSVTRELKLNLSLRHVDRAIAAIAEEISTTGEADIPYLRADQIVTAILPGDGTHERDLLFQLIASGLLSVDQMAGAEFVRFTFERYGDYILASGLLDRSVTSGDVVAAMAGPTPLGVLFATSPWNHQGVIEILAILTPERHGIELPDAVPPGTMSYFVEEAFTASLVTRAPDAFTDRTWALIGETGGVALEFDTLIQLATDPDSPSNAMALHDRLMSQPMPERDAAWSAHIALQSDIANRLVDWALEVDMGRVAADRADLAATCLSWFFSTSSRRLRDRATKALVVLLKAHPGVVEPLLARFAAVDDGYVLERLLAAIYGAALQGRWTTTEATGVVEAVHEAMFAAAGPPLNVLTRDHASNLIAWACHTGALPATFDRSRAVAPWTSPWPIEHIPNAVIKGFTEIYESGYVGRDQIVASCVNDGDFARYVIDGAVGRWSPALRGVRRLPTRKTLHDRWESEFRKAATPGQRAAYKTLKGVIAALPDQGWLSSSDKETYEAAKAAFAGAVPEPVYERWRAEAEHWRRSGMYQGIAPRDHAEFNLAWARRWVCWRAHDLGWSAALHGGFDRSISNDRMAHAVERIGKKYQWLALYELMARMADNLEPAARAPRGEPEELRNIDPSLILGSETPDEDDDPPAAAGPDPWAPVLHLPSVTLDAALEWRDVEDDLPDGASDLEYADEAGPDGWLLVKGFHTWRGGPDRLRREVSRWVTCVVVPRASKQALLALVSGDTQIDHDGLGVEDRVPWRSHLGEHAWRWIQGRAAQGWVDNWKPRGDTTIREGVRLRGITQGYLAETGGFDYSIHTNIDARVPQAWLIEALGLRLVDGRDILYADAEGSPVYREATAVGGRTTVALLRRQAFLAMLKRQKLTAIWLTGGEKNIYGTSGGNGFGGRRYYSSVVWSDGGPLQAATRGWSLSEPDPAQLAALTAANP